MPGTLIPAQMFDHRLDAIKGWGAELHCLDHQLQAYNSSEGIVAGMCVYKDPSTGKARRGCVNGYMPLFVFQNQDDFDVNSDVGGITSGNINTLPATGGYELETTEFVDETFAPNDPLTVSVASDATKGKVKKTTMSGGLMIVGIVSAVKADDEYGISTLRFWPVFCPVHS